MDDGPTTSMSEHFASLTDPRVERSKEHLLIDVVTIALCAVIRGADDWVAIETFGREKVDGLRTFLPLRGGIPSHATFGRVLARLDPDGFRRVTVPVAPSSRRECLPGWIPTGFGAASWTGCRRLPARSSSKTPG